VLRDQGYNGAMGEIMTSGGKKKKFGEECAAVPFYPRRLSRCHLGLNPRLRDEPSEAKPLDLWYQISSLFFDPHNLYFLLIFYNSCHVRVFTFSYLNHLVYAPSFVPPPRRYTISLFFHRASAICLLSSLFCLPNLLFSPAIKYNLEKEQQI
jgi:hypothetical protein